MASTSSSTKRSSKSPRRGKCLPRRVQDLSKEELLLTLQKKRECNAKALTIVEGMLEPKVDGDWFLNVLCHINQSHLQDVTEERAIINLCGYPLCSNELKNIPSQQYRISTRVNKVYDIKERKNFCSNKCFKAYKFVKDQMHTSPLWLRDIEPNVKFILMPSTETGGGVGDEINVQIERVTKEEIKKLSGEDNYSSLKQTDDSSTLVDALNNLHIVANMREKNPLKFSEDLNSTDTEKEKNLQHEIERNITLEKDIKDKNMESTHGSIVKEIRDDEESKLCDSQDLHLIPTKGSYEVHNPKTGDELLLNDPKNDVIDVKELDCSIDPKGTASSRETSSISMSISSPLLCSSESRVDRKSQTDDIGNTHSTDEKVSEEVKIPNKKSMLAKSVFSSEIKPECVINQISSSNLCQQPPATSRNKVSELTPSDRSIILDDKNKSPATGPSRQHSTTKSKEMVQKKKKGKSFPVVAHVEKCVREWFTMETMCFLFGETTLKEMLEHKGECIHEHYKALNSITWDQEKHERFLAICKRLKLLEMEDSNFDSQVMKSEGDSKRKPLPHYEVLKREAEAMELKVNAFYKGKMEINERKVSFAHDVKSDSSDSVKDSEVQIPLVHLHSQRALRKRIVLDGLNRVLPDFLRTFGMRPSELTSSVRGLVSTFALSATNITFKPQEWSLLGLIVIKLLALRETELRQCLHQEQSNTYLTLMLMSYKQEPGYLDRLLSWLTDIDLLLERPQGPE